MNKNIFLIFVVFISCESSGIKKPIIHETNANYMFTENKYALIQDSVFGFKSVQKIYHLKIQKDSNKLIAYWTDKIPRIAVDTNTNELDNLLNNKEFIDGFTAKYILKKNGDIDSLYNWVSLKEYVDSLTSKYYENLGLKNEEINRIKPFVNTIQTKKRLVSNLNKGILAYHNFYSIDATFDDTLVSNEYGLELNQSVFVSSAKIEISKPLNYLVDYFITSEYEGDNDLNFLSALKKLEINDLDFNQFKTIRLKDTLYYRYNRNTNLLENIFFKRNMIQDTIQYVNEIELIKR